MIDFDHIALSAPHTRVLEHMRRLLDGRDLDLVGLVLTNVMIDVALLETNGDVAAADCFIDALAVALKRAVREHCATIATANHQSTTA